MQKNNRSADLITLYQGGLGNQLFICAAQLELSKQHSLNLISDITSGFECDHIYQRSFRLNDLGIDVGTICKTLFASKRKTILGYFIRYVFPALGLVCDKILDSNYSESISSKTVFSRRLVPLVVLDGYFQKAEYDLEIFRAIVNQIDGELLDDATSLYEKLVGDFDSSVAIHVRIFQDDENELDKLLRYYKSAVAEVRLLVEHPVFYVVTEDIEKVDFIFQSLDVDYKIIDNNYRSDIEDLLLLSCFKTIIIAESTFSWWAAKIGETRGTVEKVIMSGYSKKIGRSSWVPEKMQCPGWVKIDV